MDLATHFAHENGDVAGFSATLLGFWKPRRFDESSCNMASFGFKKSRSLVVTLVQRWKSMTVPWKSSTTGGFKGCD